MLISTKGRYALRVMADLAGRQTRQYVPLRDLALAQDISEKYLEAIIKLLVNAQLLSGLRGKGGGYRLTRPPEGYTVGEILRATEDSLAPVSCLDREALPCARSASCPTRPIWQGLEDAIDQYLDGVTLAELVRPDGDGGSKG